MLEEKQFGLRVTDAQSILGSRDLFQLKMEDETMRNRAVFADKCQFCTLHTTGKVPEEYKEELSIKRINQ